MSELKVVAKTKDGVEVKPGDKVWVQGSTSVQKAVVKPFVAYTDYEYFGPIPVGEAFSTKKAAEKARYGKAKR
ncbi:MAG: hypothetical protein WBI92_11755 [Cloacibacterium sp.]|uniref:hypothetical protein n=1 Tax=Cloacibacterium sp. TaxID=1913682 RepID=UPI003C71CA4E